MEEKPVSSSISVFSNKFTETVSPKQLSMIDKKIGGSSASSNSIMTYGAIIGGSLLGVVVLLAIVYVNRNRILQTFRQSILHFYLGKPNEIHAIEIPENSRIKQVYDNFDMLNLINAI
jgi:hypothetical protein